MDAIKFSNNKKLEQLLLDRSHDGKAIAQEFEQQLKGKVLFRCQQCQATNWSFPHVLHMAHVHGVSNYWKTLHEMVPA